MANAIFKPPPRKCLVFIRDLQGWAEGMWVYRDDANERDVVIVRFVDLPFEVQKNVMKNTGKTRIQLGMMLATLMVRVDSSDIVFLSDQPEFI